MEIEIGSHSVVDEVTVDDVAGEVIVDDDICGHYARKQKRTYTAAPSTVLRTNDYLRGRPRVYVPPGRPAYAKLEPGEEVEEGPPRLADPDGSYATPSMRPHFRIYADATLRKADHIFQVGASTSQSVPAEEEVRVRHQLNEEVVTGEELEHILEEAHVLEQQDAMGEKQEMYYGAEDEQSMRADEYEMHWPLFAEQAIDFPDACDILLGNVSVPEDKICKTVPHGYRGVGTVLIDLSSVERHELGMDGLGSWGKPSGRTRFYLMSMEANKYECVSDARGQLPKGDPYDVKCQLRKYEHPATSGANRFIKKIISCVSKDNQPVSRLAIITYEWIGTPFDFNCTAEPRRTRSIAAPPPPQGTRNWEQASIQASAFSSFPSTCTAMMGDCPLYSMGAIQFQDVSHIIMGATIVDESKICDRIPQRFRESGTFVIAVTSLGSEHELRRDDNGQWGKPAGNSRYYKYDGTTAVRIDRSGKLEPGARAEGSYDVQILCKRYEHPATHNRFVRKIYTGRSPLTQNYHQTFDLAVVTYFWKGEPAPFEIIPQRKVRVHNASEYELIKRNGNLQVFEEEMEEAMIEREMAEGGNIYMEDDSALIEDEMPVRMMEQPARKRRKADGTSMAAERQAMQQEAAGLPSEDDLQCAKMALENQERFSMLLDRFESVAEKMERMTEMQMNMMWRTRQYVGDHEARDRPDSEAQYEEVEYVMEGEGGG